MSRAGTRPFTRVWSKYRPGLSSIGYTMPPYIAAREAGIIWTDDNLFQYLKGPKDFLDQKTGKNFNGAYYMTFFIGQEAPRRDVIAYLKAIKDHPECD